MNNMKYLVTGGAGFIGSHLVESLLNDKYNIIVIDDLSSGFKENIPDLPKNKLMIEKVQKVSIEQIGSIDGIFHLAAQASVPISIDDFYASSTNNLNSSLKVWDIAKRLQIPVVYASSSAVYGNLPMGNDEDENVEILSPYAQDKLTMEDYARMCGDIYKIPSAGLRFFNVYGPRQDPLNPYSGVISIFIDRLLNKMPVSINGGHQTRDFIYVDDVVKIIYQAMSLLNDKQDTLIFNVGTGTSTTINNLLELCIDIIGFTPKVINKPLQKSDPVKSMGSYTKMQSILDIDLKEFIKIEDGLIKTIKYFKDVS